METKKTVNKFMILSALFASGCSTYQESFDCPVGEGVRCASLSTINKKMDKGEIALEEETTQVTNTTYGSEFTTELMG